MISILGEIFLFLLKDFWEMLAVCFIGGVVAAIAVRVFFPEEIKATSSWADVVGVMCVRLSGGLLVVAIFLILGILSALPYGGGNVSLFRMAKFCSVMTLLWTGFTVIKLRTKHSANKIPPDDEFSTSKKRLNVYLIKLVVGIALVGASFAVYKVT